MKTYCIYALYKNQDIIYIGCTNSSERRQQEHKSGPWLHWIPNGLMISNAEFIVLEERIKSKAKALKVEEFWYWYMKLLDFSPKNKRIGGKYGLDYVDMKSKVEAKKNLYYAGRKRYGVARVKPSKISVKTSLSCDIVCVNLDRKHQLFNYALDKRKIWKSRRQASRLTE